MPCTHRVVLSVDRGKCVGSGVVGGRDRRCGDRLHFYGGRHRVLRTARLARSLVTKRL